MQQDENNICDQRLSHQSTLVPKVGLGGEEKQQQCQGPHTTDA